MNSYYIYRHTSPNGRVYVGMTCQKPQHRWNRGRGYRYNKYFWRDIKKYGWRNIRHEVLFKGLTELDARLIEEDFIWHYNHIGHSYNRIIQ